ncbi:MAG: CPBP family intramembrane metalloprotease [Lachnospiraceae bacterium]|nr:CPBP family intramembrane metalloprotease [Lachnospiraceae bacterium]
MKNMSNLGSRFKESQKEQEEQNLSVKRIWLYLFITFTLTYGVEIFLIMPLAGSADIQSAMFAQLLKAGVMFFPAFGVILTRMITRETFVGKTMMIHLRLKGNLRYYALSWFGIGGLILFGAAVYFVLFPGKFDPQMGYAALQLSRQAGENEEVGTELVRQAVTAQLVMGFFLSPFANLLNCFGEEWGWRGYLLPKLLNHFKIVPTLLLSGMIWGIWHMPLIIMGHNYGVGYRGYPIAGILAMCVFCTVIGIIFSYMTIRTGSCIPAVLGHGMLNGFAAAGMLFTSLEDPFNVFIGPAPTGLAGGIGFILLAAYFLYRLYQQEKKEPIQIGKLQTETNKSKIKEEAK